MNTFARQITVVFIDRYRDGGTTIWADANGNRYWIDKRIKTKTLGAVYDRHPNEEGAQKLEVKLLDLLGNLL